MNEKTKIVSYSVELNNDGSTYCVTIQTDAATFTYKTVDVKFLQGDVIVFPVGLKVYGKSGEIVNDWDLTNSQNTEESPED